VCLTVAVGLLGSSLSTTPRGKGPRVRPSRLLDDGFVEVLCRPPSDVETVQWDSRPFDKSTLEQALEATEEFRRLQQVRRSFFDLLRREATREDCAQLRGWIDRRLDLDAVRQEIANLPEADRRGVRRKQRLYLEAWVHLLTELRGDLDDTAARTVVHCASVASQSTLQHSAGLPEDRQRELLRRSPLSVLTAEPTDPYRSTEGTARHER